jgi:hypothetical protein
MIKTGNKFFTLAFLAFSSLSCFSQSKNDFFIDDGDTSYFYNPYKNLLKSSKSTFNTNITFTSSNLPILKIITNGEYITDNPKVSVDFGTIYNGKGVTNYVNGAYSYFGKIAIEERGSSSQMFPKKNYGFELKSSTGDDTTASLLDMPEEGDWILSGPYTDKTFMRDALTYYLGNQIGHYNPRTVFCELVIDNDYKGVFVLIERIKRDKNRVDIAKLNPDEVSGVDLTGGYIFKVDRGNYDNKDGWFLSKPTLDKYIYAVFVYPKPEDLVSEQYNYLKNYVTEFENALSSDQYTDPDMGYRNYIGIHSFTDFLIMNELGRNIDGYRLSSFFYKDKDSKIKAGPLWDFNLAFGNADYCNGSNAEGWSYDFGNVCPDDGYQVPFWWGRMISDKYFANELYCRWTEFRNGPLHLDSIYAYIDNTASLLEKAQQRNYSRWSGVLGNYVWPNNYVGQTYKDEINYMKDWIKNRIEWMDVNIEGVCNPVLVQSIITQSTIRISPNPVSDAFALIINSASAFNADIKAFNVMGQCFIISKNQYFNSGVNNIPLHFNAFKQGVYLIKIETGETSLTAKLLKY